MGWQEWLIILAIIIIIFGASKLPQLGNALGKGIQNFKRAMRGEDEIDVTPRRDELREPPGSAAKPPGDKGADRRAGGGEEKGGGRER